MKMNLSLFKNCFKCGSEKPLAEFYRHKNMADGFLNKCKCCAKQETKRNRLKKIDYYKAYDLGRYAECGPRNITPIKDLPSYKKKNKYNKKWRDKNKHKVSAHNKVQAALRSGLIKKPTSCWSCKEVKRLSAHHEDYSAPLDIIFVCDQCHKQIHMLPGANQ